MPQYECVDLTAAVGIVATLVPQGIDGAGEQDAQLVTRQGQRVGHRRFGSWRRGIEQFIDHVAGALAAGYLDPFVGGGMSNVAAFLVLLAMLLVRPYGLFGGRAVERV